LNSSNHNLKPVPRASFRHLLVALTDIVGALILTAWGLVLGPLGFLRGTLSLGNIFWYVWVLSPQGLLSRLVKAAIDWRLGNFDAAVFQLEFLSSRVEKYLILNPKYRHAHTVLEDFYTLLVRSYLHGGHIDDAMMVVLRAKKHLGTDRLPSLARLDAKTAHLVRAGLAAGKLLDGGGLATLFVKSGPEPSLAKSPPMYEPPQGQLHKNPQQSSLFEKGPVIKRQGASAKGATLTPVKPQMGLLLQFPIPSKDANPNAPHSPDDPNP
jgi:hypothetical protein